MVDNRGMAFSALQLASYLDKVRRSYPYGIPRRAISSNSATSVGTSPSTEPLRCLLLVISEDPKLDAADLELVQAIAIKGLGIPESEYKIVLMPAGTSAKEIGSCVDAHGAPFSIVFGLSADSKGVEIRDYGTIVHGQPLERIRTSAETKRAFWSLLKAHSVAK